MNRRAFISALGGAAAGVSTWPLAARAQQGERIRRIGMLIGLADGDPEVAKYVGELQEGLRALGWNEGKNLRIDHRSRGVELNSNLLSAPASPQRGRSSQLLIDPRPNAA